MTATSENLLVKFRSRDTQFGVTRGTVKALAKALDVNETQVIHMALSKFATDVLPAYAPDDGPLTSRQINARRQATSFGVCFQKFQIWNQGQNLDPRLS